MSELQPINYTTMLHRVHNLREGNHSAPDGYSSWIEYWGKATNCKAAYCHVYGCKSKASDGAHVQLDDPSDNRWYIVPMCHFHNCQFGVHLTVKGPIVSATDPSIIRR